MAYFLTILVFLFGASLGSFILVIADRYNTGLPFLKGRSFCFSCNTPLQTRDLIPVFSFLFSKGKCRHCGSMITKESLLIELLMGLLAVFLSIKFGIIFLSANMMFFPVAQYVNFLIILLIFSNILLITIYDIRHFIIPDSFLLYLFSLSLLYILLNNPPSFIGQSLFSGIVLTIPFLLIFLISKGMWIGLGDVKYIFIIGFIFGLSQGLSVVILSFWMGAAFALFALMTQRLNKAFHLPIFDNNLTIKSEIPFGPFLSLSIVLVFYFNFDLFHLNYLLNVF